MIRRLCSVIVVLRSAARGGARREAPKPRASDAGAAGADLARATPRGRVFIGPEDILDISVWKNPELSLNRAGPA